MKTNKTLWLALIALALNAYAAPVSVETARFAAGSWALSDAALGVPHGVSAGDAVAYDVDGTNGFYAVSIEGGGTLFVAADDEIDPILAFTASSSPDLSAQSPLLNLLVRDVRARRGQIGQPVSYSSSSGRRLSASAAAAASADSGARAKKMWEAFVPSSSGGRVRLGATAKPRTALATSEIRVAPILTTQWSQTNAGSQPCYNYYTPNHYPCGCVATAAGQILNRWKYPTGELEQFSNTCTVNGGSVTLTSTGSPRVYNWEAMVDKPSGATGEESRKAIGALLSDLGISFGAGYASDGTSAYEFDVPGPLHRNFNYASAYTYTVNGTGSKASALHKAEVRQRAILANLDAKQPVELYILSNAVGGHAVVADGYGFVTIGGEEVEFTHINMGWAGADDMWYNLPVINTSETGSTAGQTGGYAFDYLMGATFNIHPTETGDILSGRVTDDDEPVEGATVTVYASGTLNAIDTTTTDAHGIYSFTLDSSGPYDVMAVSADGKKSGSLEDITLRRTTVSDTSTYVTKNDSDIGNSWGNDIDIVVPHVRVLVDTGAGVVTNLFSNLNLALMAASTNENPVVEIFGPTRLKQPVTITTNVTVRTVPDYSADFEFVLPTLDECEVSVRDTAVTSGGWALQIADASRVAFSNIVVRAESGRRLHLDVLATGKAAFSGRIDLGKVVTHTDDAIVLTGPIEHAGDGLLVASDGENRIDEQFGTYECADDVAEAYAGIIGNVHDSTLSGKAKAGGILVWDRTPIDPSVAVAKAVNSLGETRYYRSMDLLFTDYADGAEVTVLRNCPFEMFTNSVTITKDMSITGEGAETPVMSMFTDASFTVTDGAQLVLTNVVFTRDTDGNVSSSGKSLFTVAGGAILELGPGTVITNLLLAGTASAISVTSGTVAMREGSLITNCVASSTQNGVAVLLAGDGCSLEMTGGLVAGCKGSRLNTKASGIYAGKGAKVSVSGTASVFGNTNNGGNNQRDLYLTAADQLSVTGRLEGKIGIFRTLGTSAGSKFAVADESLSDADAESSFSAFFNNANTTTSPSVSDDKRSFVWIKTPTGPVQVSETDADVSVEVDGVHSHYAKIEDAFAVATNGTATMTLHRDISLTNCLAAKTDILFDGCGHTMLREGDFTIAVTNFSFSITNAVFDGGTGTVRFVDVASTAADTPAALTLGPGAVVRDACGEGQSVVAAIVVWNGTFTILPGAEISNCTNYYVRYLGGPLAAGAVVVDGVRSVARLYGGTIHNCAGSGAGGVYIGNTACAYVRGDVSICDNVSLSGEPSNLVVQDRSRLVLDGEFAGGVRYTEGVGGSTNVFGTVADELLTGTRGDSRRLSAINPSAISKVVEYAKLFVHDTTGSKGIPAINQEDQSEVILVWRDSVAGLSVFTNEVDGVVKLYDVIDDASEVVECAPFAFAAIKEVSPGMWKLTLTNGTAYCTYRLYRSGDLKTWDELKDRKRMLVTEEIEGAEKAFHFDDVPGDGAVRFWKVEGENGARTK